MNVRLHVPWPALVALTTGLLMTTGSLTTITAQPAAAAVADGSSAESAAPSCWAVKQAVPAAPSGVYWLQTGTSGVPAQFYCDQVTDGGGWVLMGRGREGWNWQDAGQGDPATLRTTITGTGAFAPATLPAATIDGLLAGGRVSALPDGIRVRRATNTTGTAWQELRLLPWDRPTWSWAIGGGERLNGMIANGVKYYPSDTRSWAADSSYLNYFTYELSTKNYRAGWCFGPSIKAANTSTGYLWSYLGEGQAIGFAQMFLRPKLTSTTYAPVAAQGLPATRVSAALSSTTSPDTPWGVTGVVSGLTGEAHLEVQALGYLGTTMYVGGEFAYVQKGAHPGTGEKIAQRYLAAFDLQTGQWLSGFRPVLNGQVWDIAATPDGKLIVAGEFTSVNGVANTRYLAALNPATGAVLPTWRAFVEDRSATPAPVVRTLDYQSGWIYLGGRFTHVTGGVPLSSAVQVGRLARVRATDGRPDGTWKPNANGTVMDLDANPAGDRVYVAGFFSQVNGSSAAGYAATLSTASGAPLVAGMAPYVKSSTTKAYQQVVREIGNDVWLGGSEHLLGRYDTAGFAFKDSWITRQGGDFQSAATVDGVVYAGCHCGNFVYSGTHTWDAPWSTNSDVRNIRFIGAWDQATGRYLAEFQPTALDTRGGNGPWELLSDPYGCLWFGGDFTRGSWTNGAYQWLGGFGKVCRRDRVAPSTPANVVAASSVTGVKLTWTASTDNDRMARYTVYRGDRPIASVTGTSYTDLPITSATTYRVVATDPTGNTSGTSEPVVAHVEVPFVTQNDSWRWLYDGVDQGTAWRDPAFDDSAWASGTAELGFGDGDESTVIAAPAATHPMTAYFRRTFTVDDPTTLTGVRLNLVRDDGAVVYVNGVEVYRNNLPDGPVTATTPALTALSTRAEETEVVAVSVPSGVLVAGQNTVAVEVHQRDMWSGDLSFSLEVAGTS